MMAETVNFTLFFCLLQIEWVIKCHQFVIVSPHVYGREKGQQWPSQRCESADWIGAILTLRVRFFDKVIHKEA